MNFNSETSDALTLFNSAFTALIAEKYQPLKPLGSAMEYALSGPGKKVRPQLAMLAAEALGAKLEGALPAAVAIEMIHVYSLVHDDLPCIDNDTMRRGRATTHIEFGEDMALLVGDGLLTDAFAVLSDKNFSRVLSQTDLTDSQRLHLVRELATATGSFGMVAGQALDVKGSAKHRAGAVFTVDEVEKTHLLKSGELMGAACSMGSICAMAKPDEVRIFREFGRTIGLVFQVLDDLLDNQDGTGKTKGKDMSEGKFSYAQLMSESAALTHAKNLTDAAINQLLSVVKEDCRLLKFARLLLDRKS